MGKKYRDIQIVTGVKGFALTAGCSTFYYSDWVDMLDDIEKYYENPIIMEKKVLEESQRRDERGEDPVPIQRTRDDRLQEEIASPTQPTYLGPLGRLSDSDTGCSASGQAGCCEESPQR